MDRNNGPSSVALILDNIWAILLLERVPSSRVQSFKSFGFLIFYETSDFIFFNVRCIFRTEPNFDRKIFCLKSALHFRPFYFRGMTFRLFSIYFFIIYLFGFFYIRPYGMVPKFTLFVNF